MVSGYTTMLGKRYKGKLDCDADAFIDFIVDGAHRMEQLVNDLLAFSRVSTSGREFKDCDTNLALQHALINLQVAIQESEAQISSDPLPNVVADHMQLTQLFQNIISNALKFKGENPPRIRITCRERAGEWMFSISDNGIGIAPEYTERIFQMFQRLHGVGKFPGTGIGLAISKRIVERHGGRIWVESEPNQGSTFHFTIARDNKNA